MYLFNARYFRTIIKLDLKTAVANGGVQPLMSHLTLKNTASVNFPPAIHQRIIIGQPDKSYAIPANKCIYCGAMNYAPDEERKLGDEHILAAGLGGNLVLPLACCKKCEGATGSAEQKVLRGTLNAARKQLGLKPSKRRRTKLNTFPCTSIVNGKLITTELPIETHPGFIVLPQYMPPGIQIGLPNTASSLCGLWSTAINFDPAKLARQNLPDLVAEIDVLPFSQMLAKTAHSFLAAEIGLHRFKPLLTDFIRWKPDKDEIRTDIFQYIGGDSKLEAPSTEMHELGWYPLGLENLLYLAVRIRMFALFGAPTYHVIGGYVTDSHLFSRLTERIAP